MSPDLAAALLLAIPFVLFGIILPLWWGGR